MTDKSMNITSIDGMPMTREELRTLDKDILIDKILSLETIRDIIERQINDTIGAMESLLTYELRDEANDR